MKKRFKKILCLFLILFLGYRLSVHADSGWDGSYDSGSSSWGSSSWGGSDWDSSSWGSFSSGSISDEIDYIIVIVVVIIIVFSIANTSSKTKGDVKKNTHSAVPYDINKIKELLPSFDKTKFQEQTYDIYKKIQTAWMNFDYETLRKYTTDELYNSYHSQLIALNVKKQKNIMKDFELNNFEIVDMEKNEDILSLKVRLCVECIDYVIDKDNKVVRGNSSRKLLYDYEMTFIKGLHTKENKCPNCNAPLENNQSTVCPYCDSTVINDNHDWVLSKKQMINQKWKS